MFVLQWNPSKEIRLGSDQLKDEASLRKAILESIKPVARQISDKKMVVPECNVILPIGKIELRFGLSHPDGKDWVGSVSLRYPHRDYELLERCHSLFASCKLDEDYGFACAGVPEWAYRSSWSEFSFPNGKELKRLRMVECYQKSTPYADSEHIKKEFQKILSSKGIISKDAIWVKSFLGKVRDEVAFEGMLLDIPSKIHFDGIHPSENYFSSLMISYTKGSMKFYPEYTLEDNLTGFTSEIFGKQEQVIDFMIEVWDQVKDSTAAGDVG